MTTMTDYLIEFQPVGRRGRCPAGQSLLECARQLGVSLVAVCGGQGTCGRCLVQVLEGTVSPPSAEERKRLQGDERADDLRMACRTYPQSDCKIGVPPSSLTTRQRTQVEGLELAVDVEPCLSFYDVAVEPPTLDDLQADVERVVAALPPGALAAPISVDFPVLRTLSPTLRAADSRVQLAVRDRRKIMDVRKMDSPCLGLALDIGTTKIAGYLVDLRTSQVLAQRGAVNPQISIGEDVVSRMTHTRDNPAEAAHLQALLVKAVNDMVGQLCATEGVPAGTEREAILEVVAVGNTAMHHLFLCLPVEQLAMSPYVPAVQGAVDGPARELGLDLAPGARLHLLPNVAGYVGADHVAMLLATRLWEAEGVALALDIGTNTEICLAKHGQLTSVSCASGPAFEGAHIRHGMRAAPGAIESLTVSDHRIDYQTIGHEAPVGLCGSGILDALAQLRLAGVVDRGGRLLDDPRVRLRGDGEREFVLVKKNDHAGQQAITLTQQDIRELQLAKGAIRAGINLLLEDQDCAEEDIDRVIIAGAFGTYIDVSSAVRIGMLPHLPRDRFTQVGNAAGMGAKLALISRTEREMAQTIARRVRYLELAADPSFALALTQATYLEP